MIDSVGKTGWLVLAEALWLQGAVAGEVVRQIVRRDPSVLKQPPSMLRMAPAPCPTARSLEDIYYPSQYDTVNGILAQAPGPEHGIELPNEASMADVYKRFRGPF